MPNRQPISICGQSVSARVQALGTAPVSLHHEDSVWLKGSGQTIKAPGGANGIDLAGCKRILITDCILTGCFRGLRAADCEWIELRNVKATLNRQQGLFFVNQHHAHLMHCEGSKTQVQHGCYFSNSGDGFTEDILVEDSVFFGSSFSEFQVLVEDGSRPAKGVRLVRCSITNDRFGVNLASVQDALLQDCTIKAKKAIAVGIAHPSKWDTSGKVIGGSVVGNLMCFDHSDLDMSQTDFRGKRVRGDT